MIYGRSMHDGTRATASCFGIVTSSLRQHFEIIHGLSGMLEHVDFAVVREDYPRSKPHPDSYLAGIDRAGLPARDLPAARREATVLSGMPSAAAMSRLV